MPVVSFVYSQNSGHILDHHGDLVSFKESHFHDIANRC